MDIGEFASRSGWQTWDVTEYARKNYKNFLKEGFRGTTLDDHVLGRFKADYEKHLAEKEQQKAKAAQEALENRTKHTVINENMTTGFGFEGYRITKYLGLVSGEAVMGTGAISSTAASLSSMAGTSSESYRKKLTSAKENARTALAKNAFALGANAVIGVNYDVFDMNSLVGFSANGTAVIIEKGE